MIDLMIYAVIYEKKLQLYSMVRLILSNGLHKRKVGVLNTL